MAHLRHQHRQIAVALLLASAFVAFTVDAHPLDIGYLRIETKGERVTVTLDLNPDAAGVLIGQKTITDPAANAKALAAASFGRAPIATPNGPCEWTGATARFEGSSLRITDSARCPSGERRWQFPFVRDMTISATFELLVKETVGGEEKVKLVDRYEPEYKLGAASYGLGDFIISGLEHIGVTPNQWHDDRGLHLPDGIDHILFLVALMLAGGKLLRLVGIATGFTLGHSVTLALATTGVIRPPRSIIEPMIALTIAFAAGEAFIGGKLDRYRWMIATAFGLIHGFAFANALVELDLQSSGEMAKALFGYNVGVELGQVSIVLVVAPLILLAHRHEVMKKYVLRVIAALIFIAGVYWFFTRL